MNRAKITAEQSQAIRESNGRPVYLVDELGQDASLAIVRVDLLRRLADHEFNIADTYEAQEAVLSKIWNDPQLDEYTDEDGAPID
jgi:hypothetical protein